MARALKVTIGRDDVVRIKASDRSPQEIINALRNIATAIEKGEIVLKVTKKH